MASANTICKKLLGVKSAVVTGQDFYIDQDGVTHLRIHARPNRRTTGSGSWRKEVLRQFLAENWNSDSKTEILEETQIFNHFALEMYTASIYNVAGRSRTREQRWGTDESERFESKIPLL